MAGYRSAKHNRVRTTHPFSRFTPTSDKQFESSLKTILEALKEEYEPEDAASSTDTLSHSPLRDLRRIQLGLSPLFFIESNLLKLLAPGCSDSRDMAMRAGNGWKALFRGDDGPRLGIRAEHDPTSVLIAQRDDIISLWESPGIRAILGKRRPGFEDSPGLLSWIFVFCDQAPSELTPLPFSLSKVS